MRLGCVSHGRIALKYGFDVLDSGSRDTKLNLNAPEPSPKRVPPWAGLVLRE